MKQGDGFQPAVVIYAGGAPIRSESPDSGGQKSGQVFHAAPVVDPFKVACEAPLLWASYINEHFPMDAQVQLVFGVCEKTVRLWRTGERAPQFKHAIIALRTHRVEATDLFMDLAS